MWDTKYRPLTFTDVLGQEGAVRLLKARLAKGTALDTSYVFSGGHGQGKTTLARILARALLCTNISKDDPEPCNVCDNCVDILNETSSAFVEQDSASRGTIEHVRAIVDDLPFIVLNAPKRVYVFDEAHRMSRDAQDVLLKPLEDKKMVGIFCTTEPEKIRGPIRSRCEEYAIRKITREDVLVRMKKILDKEGVVHEDDAVLTVIDYSGGHVRDVLNRLEMIAQAGEVTVASVREYLHLNVVSTYYEILLSIGDSRRAIELVEYATERVNPEEVAAGLAEAAMNSFRLANNMFAEFVYVDRALGKRMWERYGQQCVQLAEFFLRSRYATKVSLICDVIALVNGIPAVGTPVVFHTGGIASIYTDTSPEVRPLPPPLPVASTTPPSAVSDPTVPGGVEVAIPPVTVSPAPAANPLPAVAAPLPKPVAPQVVQPPKANGKGMRSDGVGPLGSGDILAQTDLDDKAVPVNMPRSRAHQPVPTVFPVNAGNDDLRVMLPEDWRREFERTWPGRS